jgi:hypothetical protein
MYQAVARSFRTCLSALHRFVSGGFVSEQLVPVHREEIIPGVLSVLMYETEVSAGLDPPGGRTAPIPAWVFASHGLEAAGQRELVLGVLRTTPQALRSPFELAAAIYQQARAGTVLKEGGRFEVGGGSLDFDPRVSGFICLDYLGHPALLPAIDGDKYQRTPLVLLPVLPEELQAADLFGSARVVALLAKHSRCHPFPWWHDPRRPSVVSPGESPSILAQLPIPRAHTPRVEAIQTGPRLDIIVPSEECTRFHELLTAAPDGFALLTGIASEAQARYVWEPGQTQPSATSCGQDMNVVRPEDLEVAGNFLLLLLHEDVANHVQLREDGFAVLMAGPTWRLFTAALTEQRPFTFRTDGEPISQVSLQLSENRYASPLGGIYQTESGGTWKPYRPSPSAKSPEGIPELHHVKVEHIRLLSAQHEFSQAISTETLGDYIREACAVIDHVMDGVAHRGEELCVQFHLAPNTQPLVQLAVRADDPQAFPSQTAQLLADRLNSVPAPAVAWHELRFEVLFAFPPPV